MKDYIQFEDSEQYTDSIHYLMVPKQRFVIFMKLAFGLQRKFVILGFRESFWRICVLKLKKCLNVFNNKRCKKSSCFFFGRVSYMEI